MIKKIQQIMHNSWLIWGIFFCTVLTLFIYRSYSVLDPDFGWHVRMGEEIIAKGIPATDPFSYSMPSYPFVDYEWLTNALFYFGLQNIGYLGLSIIFSTLAVIALVIQRFAWPKQFALFSQLVGAAVLTDFVGIRPQVITWLFFSFLLTVLLKDGIWGRLRYIMPLLFLFWANMHGGFIVGLICLFIWALYQAKIEYLSKLDAIIIVICFLITLLNPYSYHLWTEIWLILTDSSLHQAIAEWRPSVFYQNFPGWLLMLVSTIGVIYYRKKLGGLYFIIFFFLLLSALSSIRNFSLFILIAIPLTTQVIQLFYKEIKNIPFAQNRFNMAYTILLIIVLILSTPTIISTIVAKDAVSEEAFYPKKAIAFFKNHSFQGNLFSDYNWGGYLDWKLREKKVFVDGRMPTWRWVSPSSQESPYAFQEYNNLLSGKEAIEPFVKKYNITTILWPTQASKNPSSRSTIQDFILSRLHIEQNKYIFPQELDRLNYRVLYKDDVSTIYQVKRFKP